MNPSDAEVREVHQTAALALAVAVENVAGVVVVVVADIDVDSSDAYAAAFDVAAYIDFYAVVVGHNIYNHNEVLNRMRNLTTNLNSSLVSS